MSITKKTLQKATSELTPLRSDITAKILEFAQTDLLFFWAEKKDLYQRQQKEWQPILDWAKSFFKIDLTTTTTLEMPDNKQLQAPLNTFINQLNDKKLACFYAATLNMRSVLLALSLINGKISADQAGNLSYLEELWQNEQWGQDNEAAQKRQERCDELKEIAAYLAT